METLTKIFVGFLFCALLLSCNKDSDSVTVKRSFTFNIFLDDHSAFKAKIFWGLNKLEFSEEADNSVLFGAGFKAVAEDILFIAVESNSISKPITLEIIENNTTAIKKIVISNNILYQIKVTQ